MGLPAAIESVLHRTVLPEAHAVRLIATRDENCLGLLNDLEKFGIVGIFAFGKNNGGDGIQRAYGAGFLVHLLGVVVFRVGAKNQKVAVAGALAEVQKRRRLVPSTHQCETGTGYSRTVCGDAEAEIFPLGGRMGRYEKGYE
jgi:hypothetical protein